MPPSEVNSTVVEVVCVISRVFMVDDSTIFRVMFTSSIRIGARPYRAVLAHYIVMFA